MGRGVVTIRRQCFRLSGNGQPIHSQPDLLYSLANIPTQFPYGHVWGIETKDVARLTSTYILHECIPRRLSDEKFSNILHRMQLVLFHNTTHGRSVHQSLRGMTGAEGRRISWNLQGLCSLYPRASLAKRWQPCGFRRMHLFSAFLVTIVGPRCGLSTASYASQGVSLGRQWRRRIQNISCRPFVYTAISSYFCATAPAN